MLLYSSILKNSTSHSSIPPLPPTAQKRLSLGNNTSTQFASEPNLDRPKTAPRKNFVSTPELQRRENFLDEDSDSISIKALSQTSQDSRRNTVEQHSENEDTIAESTANEPLVVSPKITPRATFWRGKSKNELYKYFEFIFQIFLWKKLLLNQKQ